MGARKPPRTRISARAERVARRYGYLTWEWFAALRGYAHPLLFAALYRLLALLGADSVAALVLAPRLLQAALSAGGDVATYVLARRLFGSRAALAALGCQLTSWLAFYAGGRSFSSSLEAPLSAAALALWPWPAAPRGRPAAALALAAAACVARPAAAALWLPLAAAEALRSRQHAFALLRLALPIGAVALAASAAVDRALYGRWVCVPWRFVSFNVLSGGAAAYGTHPWHWYASNGLPTALGALTPLAVAGALLVRPGRRALPAACGFFCAALSASAHKEFRFLLPLLPPASALAGAVLAALHDAAPPPGLRALPGWLPRGKRFARTLAALIAVLHAVAALYLSLVHQSAPGPAMAFLAAEAAAGRVGSGGILMLTPCHETPGYSHLHAPVPLRILDCSPQPDGSPTQRDAFFAAPATYLAAHLEATDDARGNEDGGGVAWVARVGAVPPPRGVPSHVVFYDDVASAVQPLLAARGYALRRAFFHAHVAVDRDQRELRIYTQRDAGAAGMRDA